jgi:hypothetical protein
MVSTSLTATNLPLGSRLRLKNTPAVNTLITNMPPESQIVARAMQQYGLILADIGSAMYVTGSSAAVNASNGISLAWDLNDIFASKGLEVLNAGDFDVVTLQPIVTGLSSTDGPIGSALTINGQNFSGAAGKLSVFFGSATASLLSVLSDTQILVTVPDGSGTVDVTVQSGVNEKDMISGNPNANVNAPIFGYGTSPQNAADKFSFLPPAPTIQHVALGGAIITLSGTNNSGPGGTYHVLASTNLLSPRTSWTVLANGSFDSTGRFSFTNAIGTIPWQCYTLRVP